MKKNYLTGDIVGVKGGLMSKLTEKIFDPSTRLYHFLIIGDYIPEDDDYEIYESIASGVRVGRLSWYSQDSYTVFRLNDPEVFDLGKKARNEASNFGRWGYDYLMYMHILVDMVKIWIRMLFKEHHLRRVKPQELPYHENHAFICTEFANAVYRKGGRPPIPYGVNPLPAGYIQALTDRKLIIVGQNP